MERKKLTGISPIISVVILIAIVFAIATLVSPWMFGLIRDVTNQTKTDTETKIKCGNAAYDFDTSYGRYGVSWDFSKAGENNTLAVKIKNTGTISLYNFSFELTVNGTTISYLNAKASTQRTSTDPLKPSQAAFINASFTKDLNDTLTNVKVLNEVCPGVYADQDV